MEYSYQTNQVCARQIFFELDGDVVKNIRFQGGCPGNLSAISKLLEGKTVDYIEENLKGNRCGMKATSCTDQLAMAVRAAYEEENR